MRHTVTEPDRRSCRVARLAGIVGLAVFLLVFGPLMRTGFPFAYSPDALGQANAKSGSGGDGDGGNDGGDHGDDGGNSGHGGGNSGHGGGDDGDEGDDGEDGDEGDDDRSGGDNSGLGRDWGDRRSREQDTAASRSRASGARQVSVTSRGIAVTYNDGARAEIRNGRYTYADRSGRRTIRRSATGADIALMKSIARGLSINSIASRGPGRVSIVETNRTFTSARVVYSNGWVEEIKSGQYRLYDNFGRFVVSRPANAADRNRLLGEASR